MFQRILGGKRLFPASSKTPFLDFSLFGDPAQHFKQLPADAQTPWVLSAPDPGLLRMVAGMAWLNQRPLAIITEDPDHTARARQILEDAAERLHASWPDETPKTATTFPAKLEQWRRELDDFYRGLNSLMEQRFGSVNAIEVAYTLLRLYPAVKALPFARAEKDDFAWTYEEYRQLTQLLDTRTDSYEPRSGELLRHFGLSPERIAELPREVFAQNCSTLQQSLLALIRQFELTAHALRPRFEEDNVADTGASSFYRMNIQAIADRLPEADTLLHWRREFALWEREIMGYGWMSQFKGLQAISLEDIHRDLLRLLDDLELLCQWAEPLWYAADHWRQKQSLAPRERKLLAAAGRLDDSERTDVFTYWYLYHWLHRQVKNQAWHRLHESEERRQLASDIGSLARQWHLSRQPRRKKGTPASLPAWTFVHAGQAASYPPDTLRLYWLCGDEAPGEGFVFQPFEDSALPMEYLHLQQSLEHEDWARPEALPFTFGDTWALWEARPGRMTPARNDGPVLSTLPLAP